MANNNSNKNSNLNGGVYIGFQLKGVSCRLAGVFCSAIYEMSLGWYAPDWWGCSQRDFQILGEVKGENTGVCLPVLAFKKSAASLVWVDKGLTTWNPG